MNPTLVAKANNSKDLEKYRILHDNSKPTLECQHELVKYCGKHGLKDHTAAVSWR